MAYETTSFSISDYILEQWSDGETLDALTESLLSSAEEDWFNDSMCSQKGYETSGTMRPCCVNKNCVHCIEQIELQTEFDDLSSLLGDDSQDKFQSTQSEIEKIPSLFFDTFPTMTSPIPMNPGESIITEEDLQSNEENPSADENIKRKSQEPYSVKRSKDNKKRKMRVQDKRELFQLGRSCIDSKYLSYQRNSYTNAIGAHNHGHSDNSMILGPGEDIAAYDCNAICCALCNTKFKNCINGNCRIPVTPCQKSKHIICITCFWVCSLLVNEKYNKFTHCECPVCNDNGETKILVNVGYSSLCALRIRNGPPSNALLTETIAHIERIKNNT